MATARGMEAAALTARPRAQRPPARRARTSFDFFQAVRAARAVCVRSAAPVGRFGDPADEVVRFGVNADTAVPGERDPGSRASDDGRPARDVGELLRPHRAAGRVAARLHAARRERLAAARSPRSRDFLDLFNHRSISLFYRAWDEVPFAVATERDQQRPAARSTCSIWSGSAQPRACRSRLQYQLTRRSALLRGAARGLSRGRPAALEQLLEDYFDVPVEVEQFVGGWYPLVDEHSVRARRRGHASEQLGGGAVAGDEVWDQQAPGPATHRPPHARDSTTSFLPGGECVRAAARADAVLLRRQFDFEVQLVLTRDEAPPCVLGADGRRVAAGLVHLAPIAPLRPRSGRHRIRSERS